MNQRSEKCISSFLLESLDCGDPYLRRNFIGASDAPIIMGVSPWRTPLQLYQEKTGLIGPCKENAAMARGTAMESEARAKFESIMKCKVNPMRLFASDPEFLMASLDGIDKDGKIVVEIKCGKASHLAARMGEIPEHYYPQLQHQMYVAKVDHMHYFSYQSEDDWVLIRCDRNDEYIENLLKTERDFWDCIKNMTPPQADKEDFIEIDDLDFSWKSLELAECRHRIKQYAARESEIEEAIIRICGGRNSKCKGMTVKKVVKKGAIDYSQIVELSDVDLEKYRKESTEYWKITIED